MPRCIPFAIASCRYSYSKHWQEYDQHLVHHKVAKAILEMMKVAKSGVESEEFLGKAG